jgi:hypothetical protein
MERRESMNRREMITTTALGAVGFATGTAFTAPACGVSKEKAVKIAGLVIELSKQAVPLLDLLGAHDLSITVDAKVIPALEKLRDALADADIPTSQSMFQNVRSVLSGVEKALSNLPESPRVITIMGILASVNVLLLTVEAFIESETPVTGPPPGAAGAMKSRTNADAIKRVLEVSRP